ncbi:MAG: hypothetical protein JOZ96_06490 [Acidobacteria bacterium]|nr:hypothetical protein [Acidobacteriota bacterium]
MKLAALSSLLVLLCVLGARAQGGDEMRVTSVFPSERVVPGQIVELRVEGMAEELLAPPADGSLRVTLKQDGATKAAAVRTAVPGMFRMKASGAAAPGEMKSMHSIGFAVPKGLHVGEAELVISLRGLKSAPFKLEVVERPQRPVVALTSILSITPAAVTPGAAPQRPGLKFERGAKGVELRVMPLADPEDADAGVTVRFKQGGTFYDAAARVVHHDGERGRLPRGGFHWTSPRDVLEVDVPELLAPGEAEVEVALRANGLTGEAAVVPAVITDAARAYESPKAAAPRLLSVAPRRVGAGQALTISADRKLALDPDASKAVVVFETPDGASSQKVEPEVNSAAMMPSAPPDMPVFFVVRAPKDLTGAVNVRVVNPARADYEGASSEPERIEVTAEALAPEVQGVAEAGAAEISRLRQLVAPDGRTAYDPTARYVVIRAAGLDPNPEFVRVTFAQEGQRPFTLRHADFILFSGDSLIVRGPKDLRAGAVRVTVENLGANGYSAPVVKTFELSPRR